MEEEYSKTYLERCSYRILQQTAKSLGLPSNVKKIYLMQLIYTKKHCSQAEVDALVNQVRLERKQRSTQVRRSPINKKKIVKIFTAISPKRDSESPPITNTPKRTGHILVGYSPHSSPIKIPQHMPSKFSLKSQESSDRILRSFNRIRKSYLSPNTSLPDETPSLKEENNDARVNIIVPKEIKFRRVNRTYVRKTGEIWRGDGLVMPVPTISINERVNDHPGHLMNIKISPPPQRCRRPSGIYPLKPEPTQITNIAIRRTDGTTSRLNAIIQKSLSQMYNFELNSRRNQVMNLIDKGTQTSPNKQTTPNQKAPNIAITDTPQSDLSTNSSEIDLLNNNCNEFTVYTHNNIRSEQMRAVSTHEVVRSVNDYQLPRINEVFSQFSTMYCKDYSQPIYVQVNNESEFGQPYQYVPEPRLQYQSSSILEKIYNINNALMNQPLPTIPTTVSTWTVNSTPVIATACKVVARINAIALLIPWCVWLQLACHAYSKTQPSAAEDSNGFRIDSLRGNQTNQSYYEVEGSPRVHDFIRNYRCDDDTTLHDATTFGVRRSSSSVETLASQELGANVTIPEMVEDALEIISQDGDYMERTGMDVRMQCILCNWAGPKIILEYHIRKDHSPDIIQCSTEEICAKYSLGSLSCRPLWLCQVLEYKATLYVLSAKYEDPDCFMATISTLSPDTETTQTGKMTIYNKVTGEPFTWEGPINQLPPSMPYENENNCFKLELSRMNLLPNSANLKLLNRELVIHSPTKVVVGQPELDNIHISLIVKILD